MSYKTLAIVFALATAFFWGVYGPALGKARTPLPVSEGGWSPFKPYVFIGLAYLVWGCLGGALAMKASGDSFSFTGPHVPAAKWGFIAGSLGAFGALTLTYAVVNAMAAKAGPSLVMPLVFGGAVCVQAIAGGMLSGHYPKDWRMWAGMGLVAFGIVLVAKFSHDAPRKPAASATGDLPPPAATTHSTTGLNH